MSSLPAFRPAMTSSAPSFAYWRAAASAMSDSAPRTMIFWVMASSYSRNRAGIAGRSADQCRAGETCEDSGTQHDADLVGTANTTGSSLRIPRPQSSQTRPAKGRMNTGAAQRSCGTPYSVFERLRDEVEHEHVYRLRPQRKRRGRRPASRLRLHSRVHGWRPGSPTRHLRRLLATPARGRGNIEKRTRNEIGTSATAGAEASLSVIARREFHSSTARASGAANSPASPRNRSSRPTTAVRR